MKPLPVGAGASAAGGTAGGRDLHALRGIDGKRTRRVGRRGWRTLTGAAPAARPHPLHRHRRHRRRRERRRPGQDGLVVRPQADVQFLAVVHQLHRRAAVCVANQIGEHVIDQGVLLELNRRPIGTKEVLDRLRFAGREALRNLDPVRLRVERHRPVVAVAVWQFEDRVIANGDRHRLGAQVVEPRLHFECAVRHAIGHRDRVREGELRHEERVLVEIQPARDPGARRVGFGFDQLPRLRAD